MKMKIAAVPLFLFAFCLVPRASFATTVTLTLEAAGASPYDFSIGGSKTYVDLTCLNNGRTVNIGETWTATATNLETLITTPGDTNNTLVGGISLGDLKDDAYLDSKYITSGASSSITLNNDEVQDAIWSVLDGSDVYTGLSGTTEDNAVKSLISAAETTSESSSFYSEFTFYAPQTWGQRDDDDQSGGEPQQFLGYTPAVTPEPSSLVLLGTGLAGLAGSMRRRYLAAKQS